MKIQIINGPNMDLLGVRQPEIYGHLRFEPFMEKLAKHYPQVQIDFFQSNSEGSIIDKLHQVGFNYDGIILNGAAYSHYSIAIADAIASIKAPVVEVHMTNIHARAEREPFREHSVTGSKCKAVIAGFGLIGYKLALESFVLPGEENI